MIPPSIPHPLRGSPQTLTFPVSVGPALTLSLSLGRCVVAQVTYSRAALLLDIAEEPGSQETLTALYEQGLVDGVFYHHTPHTRELDLNRLSLPLVKAELRSFLRCLQSSLEHEGWEGDLEALDQLVNTDLELVVRLHPPI